MDHRACQLTPGRIRNDTALLNMFCSLLLSSLLLLHIARRSVACHRSLFASRMCSVCVHDICIKHDQSHTSLDVVLCSRPYGTHTQALLAHLLLYVGRLWLLQCPDQS